MVCPELRTSRPATSSTCASTAAAKRRSSRARSPGETRRHESNAPLARSIAASVSSAPAPGTVAMTSPVAGLITFIRDSLSSTQTTYGRSQSFKAAEQFPVGDRRVEGRQLHPGVVRVVVDHLGAEGRPGDRRALPQLQRFAEGTGHALRGRVVVGVADELRLQ